MPSLSYTDVQKLRLHKPETKEQLQKYLHIFFGVKLGDKVLWPGMSSPMEYVWKSFSGENDRLLRISARGSGKTTEMAIGLLLDSIFIPHCLTSHLAPTQAQSAIAYRMFRKFFRGDIGNSVGNYNDSVIKSTRKFTEFQNGSSVSIVVATDNGVRGDHVQRLSLDECDNLDYSIYETSIGMIKDSKYTHAQIRASSTWNTATGLVSSLIKSWNPNDIFISTYLESMQPCTGDCNECKKVKTKDNIYTLYESCHGGVDDGINYGRASVYHPSGGADGHISFREIKLKFTELTYERWTSEYESQCPRSAGAMFPWFLANHKDYHANNEFVPSQPLLCGADYGSSHDPTVFIFGQYINKTWYILDAFEVLRKDSYNAVKDAAVFCKKRFGKIPDTVYRDPSASGFHCSLNELWPTAFITYPGGKMRSDKKFRLNEAVGIPGVSGRLFINDISSLDELRNEMATLQLTGERVVMPGRSPDYVDALSYLMAGRLQEGM